MAGFTGQLRPGVDLAGVAQKAAAFQASNLSNRVTELQLENFQRKAARQEETRGIFQRSVGPQGQLDPQAVKRGLQEAGQFQELFDFQKVQTAQQQAEATLANTIGTGTGIDFANAIKQNDIIGRAAIGLTQGFTNLTDQGVPRAEAIQKLQPLYQQVLQGVAAQDIDISGLPQEFDPDLTLATVFSSKSAADTLNQQQTRAAADRPSVTAGANEVTLEIFDTSFRKATPDQRKIVNAVRQNRKRSVSAASGLEAQKVKEKLLVTGKSAESAGKASGIKVAIGNVKLLRSLLFNKKGEVKKLEVLKSKFGVGSGRMINFLTRDTLSSRLRLESGAVISKEELDDMAERFTISITPFFSDSDELANLKLDKLEEFLLTADNFVDPSGIFNFAEFNSAFPSDLGKPIKGGGAASKVRRFNPATGKIE
jgi:hypothetical protein